jgi:hypothetical protein
VALQSCQRRPELPFAAISSRYIPFYLTEKQVKPVDTRKVEAEQRERKAKLNAESATRQRHLEPDEPQEASIMAFAGAEPSTKECA